MRTLAQLRHAWCPSLSATPLLVEKDKFIMCDRGTAILDFMDLRSLTDTRSCMTR